MPPPIPLALRTAAAPLEATSARMREATRRVEGDEQQEAGGKQQEHEGSTTTIVREKHEPEQGGAPEGETELELRRCPRTLPTRSRSSRCCESGSSWRRPICLCCRVMLGEATYGLILAVRDVVTELWIAPPAACVPRAWLVVVSLCRAGAPHAWRVGDERREHWRVGELEATRTAARVPLRAHCLGAARRGGAARLATAARGGGERAIRARFGRRRREIGDARGRSRRRLAVGMHRGQSCVV